MKFFISFHFYLFKQGKAIKYIHKLLCKLPCAKKKDNPIKIYNFQDRNNKLKVVKSSRSSGIERVPLCSGVFETGFELLEIF